MQDFNKALDDKAIEVRLENGEWERAKIAALVVSSGEPWLVDEHFRGVAAVDSPYWRNI